jgi:hypothetical protein
MQLGKLDISRRRAQVRQACAAILSGFTLFALIQLGLAIGVDNGLQKVRDPLYGCRLDIIRRRVRMAPVRPWTVLMLGSSRTQFGLRVGIGEEKAWAETLGRPVLTFNFGIAGGGPMTELLTWRRLRRDGVRPNLLLVEVLPPLLCDQRPPRDYGETFLPTDRLSWQDLALVKRYTGSDRTDLRRDWLESWPLPWYAHRLGLMSLVRPDFLPPEYRLQGDEALDESGGLRFLEGPVTPATRVQATQRAHDGYGVFFTGFRLGGPQCEALRELLSSCRQEGVPAKLVLMPEGPTFRGWYSPETWQAIHQWLAQLSQEYDAPLVNAREWIDDENYYQDSHHLLASGAHIFTERLGRESILPSLQRMPR